MKAQPIKKQATGPILVIWMILIIGLSSCDPTNQPQPTSPSSFEYQVRVQAKDTGADLAGAQVRIEVGTQQAPLNEITDANGTARIFMDSSREGQPARLIVETPGFRKYVQNIDLIKGKLPTIIQLESEQAQTVSSSPSATKPTPTATLTWVSPVPKPTLTNTPTSVATSAPTKTTLSTSCPWISYLNGAPPSSLSNNNCLNDLMSVGISGDEKRISFFVSGGTLGTYGVCRGISKNDALKFRVVVQDNLAAARFLITVGPEPVPDKKSSHSFRIQPQPNREKEIWIKFIEYESDRYPHDLDEIQAIPNWKYLETWSFDFVFQFSGAQINASMNQALSEQWPLNSPSRYLCFAYEAMTTATEPAQLDVHIQFP
jgi:hypothetical protein